MLVNYGSDSDSSDEENVSQPQPVAKKSQEQTVKAAPKASSSPALPLPKPRRRDGPLKITLEAPKRAAEDEEPSDVRPAKKAKLEGTGGSSLLGMLPPPKNKTPVAPKKATVTEIKPTFAVEELFEDGKDGNDEEMPAPASSLSLIPPSRLAKGKEKAAPVVEPLVDFFSLETTTNNPKPPMGQISEESEFFIPIKSAAPAVKEFVPPVPTPNDEYPGYYQLPNKQWAMHDPAYYNSVAKAWNQTSVEEEMRRRAGPAERVRKQWEGDEADLQQVNAMDEASRAIAEIESTKSITAETLRAGPTAPNMKMTAARSSTRAKSRHQLSTLLTDAYSRRAEIEDKIAMSKRNRKESGNKYGF